MEATNPQEEGHSLGLSSPHRHHQPSQQSHLAASHNHHGGYGPNNVSDSAHHASNLHAASANASVTVSHSSTAPGSTYSTVNVNPDDFYRTYRGVQSATPVLQSPYPSNPDPMASAATPQRKNPVVRSNGVGPAPKRLAVAISQRAGLRSTSAPLDRPGIATRPSAARAAAVTPGTSVKDLKKKFDQQGRPQPGIPPTTRRTSSRVSSRSTSPSGATKPSAYGPSSTAYSTLRSSVARDAGRSLSGRGTQRQKYAAEDQLSNNSQSFASRIGKPRNTGSPQKARTPRPVASRLTPEPSPILPTESITAPPRSQPLLFGEILPNEDPAAQSVGFGIETRPRRTSESSVHIVPRQHQRSLSDPDVDLDPQSPTDWYRGVSRAAPKKRANSPMAKNHGRAQSDLAGSRASSSRSTRNPNTPSSSRIPLSVRKLQSPTGSSSPPSSRASSPSTKLSTPRPIKSTTTSRTRTPTKIPGSKREAAAANNTRLAVSISSPPPKTSPQLRSSRPRQPVSSATTASSRMKMVDRATKQSQHPQQTQEPRRRKISIGPIDFEQRREHIRLAYTKSIRASQVLEARHVAAELKRREAEDAANAKEEAAGERRDQQRDIETSGGHLDDPRPGPAAEDGTNLATQDVVDVPLRIATTFESNEISRVEDKGADKDMDSPTLGMPGSFPLPSPANIDEEPRSAISNNTAVTEFDGEEQTEPAREQHLSPIPDTPVEQSMQPIDPEPVIDKVSYRQPACFDEEENSHDEQMTIPISLDTSAPIGLDRSHTITETIPEEPVIPGAFRDEYELQDDLEQEYEPQAAEVGDHDQYPTTEEEYVQESATHDGYEAMHGHDTVPEPRYSQDEVREHHYSREEVHDHSYRDEEIAESEYAQQPPEPQYTHEEMYETHTIPEDECESQPDVDDEYEPLPYTYQPSGNETTTVTIVSREPAFPSPTATTEEEAGDRRSAHMLADEEQNDYRVRFDPADIRTLRHISHSEEETTPIEDTQDKDGLEGLEQFYVGPNVRDSASLHRNSTYDSKEPNNHARSSAAHTEESSCTSLESHRGPGSTRNLSVPSLLAPANRASHYSEWTDFSVDSADSPVVAGQDSMSNFPALDRKATAGSESQQRYRDSRHSTQPESPQISPSEHRHKHQLPELDTGGGFSLPYLSQSDRIPKLPDHAPPPIPAPPSQTGNDSNRTSMNGYYHSSRPGSLNYSTRDDRSSFTMGPSRRESQDYYPTPSRHSMDQASFDSIDGHYTPGSGAGISSLDISRPDDASTLICDDPRPSDVTDQDREKHKPSGKEKSRLIQRQMVIRELVDTESIFIRDLNIVEEIYKGTAEACPKLDAKTIKLIFRNTDEIITFHAAFAADLRDAVCSVYTPKGRRSPLMKEDPAEPATPASATPSSSLEIDDSKDRQTALGLAFIKNIEQMKAAHEGFLRSSDHAAKRLIEIQDDETVKVWLNECNEVAKDLTQAWNLDSLLIKPMQRITKYPNLIAQLLQYTPADHPDREPLTSARVKLEEAILEINKTKKNFELVGQIVGRKRKESDVRAGIARVLGKRVDKLQASSNRPPEDPDYAKYHERFGDDYLRLQVVLRDVEFYTRQVTTYVHEFLQYLSSMELVMRLQPSPYPELESRWVRFNVSMRDIEKVTLEQHLSQVRKNVIEPFELVIKSYSNPSLAMKKRAKRRLDYERSVQLKKGGKKMDRQLTEQVEQYEALNETLKKELPRLSALTEKIGNICLGNFVNIQAKWYSIWQEKVKGPLDDTSHVPETLEIIASFNRNFQSGEEQINSIRMLCGSASPPSIRTSQSTTDESLPKLRQRPTDLSSPRGRGLSVNSEATGPTLPTPDFAKRHSGQFTLSPSAGSVAPSMPSPGNYYRDYYSNMGPNGQGHRGGASPITPGMAADSRSYPAASSVRPSTGRSYESGSGMHRPGPESPVQPNRRDSNSTFSSNYYGQETRRFSGIFHSALPLPDDSNESQRSSRASSKERTPAGGYNVLWLAASLFEFNIETTKHEAGYPYLTYQAGEIFDVIAEKGELWLAKNQDDPKESVGWIWSKHFAKLADS
ncbi:rho guanyl nucleotide exchange [Zalerion maritima]|uniref:Rho guanyl nucleotide exchange n=1 Tax=Zalerion maritima TaxID=339359 RepID=A0AAD5RQ78_9PEZI|nr:rho guanyl nucleotide exchange [Zalerion maritima]